MSSGSAIWSYGGSVKFSQIGGKIFFANNVDAKYIATIKGNTILFENVKKGIVFQNNRSRAIHASTSVMFKSIEGGILFDGHSSGLGNQQGGTIAADGASGTQNIVFQDVQGGIILRNSIGCTGGGMSAVNSGDILFDRISGNVLFEHNVVRSGPAAAIRAGNLTMSHIDGNLIFSDNKCAAESSGSNYGGAIHASGGVTGVLITDVSGDVVFSDNEASSMLEKVRGGAIWSNMGTTITNIAGNIEFTNNAAYKANTTGEGGAIYSKKVVHLEAAGAIIFSGNQSKNDGATIYATDDIMMSAGDKGILFDKNSAGGRGGALYTTQNVHLASDEAVVFSNNKSVSHGGAIYAKSIEMTAGKGGILFDSNSTEAQGGAISVSEKLTLNALTGNIEFSNNNGKDGSNDLYIRQNYFDDGISSVTFNATMDRSIIFNGSVLIEHCSDMMINTVEGSTGIVAFIGSNGIVGSTATNKVQNITIGGGTVIISNIEGQGIMTLGSAATLISGFTSVVVGADGSKILQTTTGLDNYSAVLNIEEGVQLGSNIFNPSDTDVWFINSDDLKLSQAAAWKGIEGAGNSQFGSVNLRGNVMLSSAQLDENDTLVVGEGAWASLSGELRGEVVLQGGTLDASQMGSSDVDGDKIHGASGSLVTKDSQKLIYLEDGTLGYDIIGLDDLYGASIQVGDGESHVPIIATGGKWNSDIIEVQSGRMIALESAFIGSGNSDSAITVFSGAHFENQGASVKNTLILKGDASVSGRGYYYEVQFEDGSRINVGKGKESGFLIVDSMHRVKVPINKLMIAPLANDDMILGFMVDGGTAASLGNTGAGTYSHVVAQTIDMTGISVEITLGDHLANLNSRYFSMSLIKGENILGSSTQQDLIILGRNDLVEDGSLVLSWDGNNLVFSGVLNGSTVTNILSPEGSRLANVLWSGTRSLSTFSQLATSQLDTLHAGATHIWGSGFGDFTSASNDGNVAGFNYQGGGYATGIDYGFKVDRKDMLTVGFAFGQSFGSHQSNDDLLNTHQRGVMVDLYSRYAKNISEKQSWDLTGSFSYGNVDNWGNIGLEAGNGAPRHMWNSEAFSVDLMFRWHSKVSDDVTLTPFLGMSYLYGSQDNIAVQGTSSERHFSDSSLQRWVVPIGWECSYLTVLGNGQKLLSFISIAYQGDISRHDASLKMNILGNQTKINGTQAGRSACVVSTGCQWAITPQWTASASYNLEVRSKMTQQAVSGTISYSF